MPTQLSKPSSGSLPREAAGFRVKAVIVGEGSVGKTWLMNRFATDRKPDFKAPTIGIDTVPVELERVVNGNVEKVTMRIWDTAGHETFRTIQPQYYRSVPGPNGDPISIGCIICYDLTNRKSYEQLGYWLNQVRAHTPPNAVLCLVGNKLDLTEEDPGLRKVAKEEAEAFAKSEGIRYFFETSAKTGQCVSEMFNCLVDDLVARQVKDEEEAVVPSFRGSLVPSFRGSHSSEGPRVRLIDGSYSSEASRVRLKPVTGWKQRLRSCCAIS
jgi:small GTP-binding protein